MTTFERYMLTQAIPALGLPGLPDDATDAQLWERASIIGYGDLADRTEEGLTALCKLLGVLPSTYEERKMVIR